MIEPQLTSFGQRICEPQWIFHVSKTTSNWFSEKGINVMSLPLLSSDLKFMENIWDLLARNINRIVIKRSVKIIKCSVKIMNVKLN